MGKEEKRIKKREKKASLNEENLPPSDEIEEDEMIIEDTEVITDTTVTSEAVGGNCDPNFIEVQQQVFEPIDPEKGLVHLTLTSESGIYADLDARVKEKQKYAHAIDTAKAASSSYSGSKEMLVYNAQLHNIAKEIAELENIKPISYHQPKLLHHCTTVRQIVSTIITSL